MCATPKARILSSKQHLTLVGFPVFSSHFEPTKNVSAMINVLNKYQPLLVGQIRVRLFKTGQFLLDKFIIRADFSLRTTGRFGLSRRVSAGYIKETETYSSLASRPRS